MKSEKLDKLSQTLTNHVRRGNTLNGLRSQELVDRYTDAKAAAIESGEWEAYCHRRGFDVNHDAYDFFA